MVYTPTTWKDRATEKSRTFTIQDNGNGTVTLIPVTGLVYEAGTPVNSVNMNKIEQGIAGALLMDGSEAMTGDLNINKSRAHVTGLVDYLFASAKYESHLCTNCYFDGARFHRYDTAVGAAILVPTRTGNVEIRIAGPGPNPIVWVSETVVWHSGNDGAGSGLDADLVRGKAISDINGKVTGLAGLGFVGGDFSPGSISTDANWGAYIKGRSGGTADIVLADSLGNNILMIKSGGVTYNNTVLPVMRDNGTNLEYFTGGQWRAVGGVKLIQRGVATLAGSGVVNVAITAVNMSKSHLTNPNIYFPSGLGGATSAIVRARLTSSTNLEIVNEGGATVPFSWEVVENY